MIVIDASVLVNALVLDRAARRLMQQDNLHSAYLIHSDVVHALRRRVAFGALTSAEGWAVLQTAKQAGIQLHSARDLADRMWHLRDNVSAYDATYVALAEKLDVPLATADARLGRAPGIRCSVTVVPD